MQAPIAEQRALLQLQAHDSAIDRLDHRRASLPEDARLAELGDALAAVDQLTAERDGTLATVQRNQARLEHEVDQVTSKARTEEARAASGKVTSPKELTAIQDEVASLKRRQGTLEDELLELMEQRETLEGELAELATRREGFTGRADRGHQGPRRRPGRDRPRAGRRAQRPRRGRPRGRRAAARPLRPGPVQAWRRGRGGRPGRQHLPGLPGVDLPGRAGRPPQAPARGGQALRELPPDPGGRVTGSAITDVVIWADGGARGNPGPAGYGAVVATTDGQVLAEEAEGIGWATNNVAEYRGVIAGLRRAKELGARRVRVRADSLLVVNQQKGLWKVKNAALRPLSEEAGRLARGFERVTWEHIPRERNRHADALANRAMDAQGRVRRPGKGAPDQEQLRLS